MSKKAPNQSTKTPRDKSSRTGGRDSRSGQFVPLRHQRKQKDTGHQTRKAMDPSKDTAKPCRILSLDGGGAKGFYTLGVLHQLEALLGKGPLYKQFDLIFGTSTGAIIASLLALGRSVAQVHTIYGDNVPRLMALLTATSRSKALEKLAAEVFGTLKFDSMKTGVGIVTARWVEERPMIFKADVRQAHGMHSTFIPSTTRLAKRSHRKMMLAG